jgi:hypothetical protein
VFRLGFVITLLKNHFQSRLLSDFLIVCFHLTYMATCLCPLGQRRGGDWGRWLANIPNLHLSWGLGLHWHLQHRELSFYYWYSFRRISIIFSLSLFSNIRGSMRNIWISLFGLMLLGWRFFNLKMLTHLTLSFLPPIFNPICSFVIIRAV